MHMQRREHRTRNIPCSLHVRTTPKKTRAGRAATSRSTNRVRERMEILAKTCSPSPLSCPPPSRKKKTTSKKQTKTQTCTTQNIVIHKRRKEHDKKKRCMHMHAQRTMITPCSFGFSRKHPINNPSRQHSFPRLLHSPAAYNSNCWVLKFTRIRHELLTHIMADSSMYTVCLHFASPQFWVQNIRNTYVHYSMDAVMLRFAYYFQTLVPVVVSRFCSS